MHRSRLECSALLVTLTLAACVSVAHAGPRLTISDDDINCPGGCDAHVVFHPTLNGTAFAHSPQSKPGEYRKCTSNSECRVCFDGAEDCMVAMYRGDGPRPRAFDFTPAFYEAHCGQPNAPAAVADQCRMLARATKTLDGRVNCIRSPDHPKCARLIAEARAAQAADRERYAACLKLGGPAFNQQRPPSEQRSDDCTSEKLPTGRNDQGKTWKRLLPAACRDGTYVGRDGTGCCAGNVYGDGAQGEECRAFYPAR